MRTANAQPEIKFVVPLGAGASRSVRVASLMTVTASRLQPYR